MYNNSNRGNRRPRNIDNRKKNTRGAKSARPVTPKTKPRANNYNNNYPYSYDTHEKKYTVPYHYEHRKRRFNIGKYLYRLLLVLILALVMFVIITAAFYFNLTRTKKQADVTYQFIITETEKKKEISVPSELGFSGSEYYIPINDLMDLMNCKVTGDKSEVSFISANTGNFMKFKVNTSTVYINNVEYHMGEPSVLDSSDGEKLYVPLNFVKNKFNNLIITHDEKNAEKITVEISDTENFAFNLQFPESLKNPGEGVEYGMVQFAADLSEYEQYFSPEDADEYLVLINRTHSLSRDYVPPDLTDVVDTRKDRATQQLRLYAAKSLEAFLMEARAQGIENAENITVTSGYRTYEYQESLFESYVSQKMAVFPDRSEAEAEVMKTVAFAGQSEHQSGLAVDMHTMGSAVGIFGETPAGKWLAENAHLFGFIVRYPEDKTEITGYSYEPWHFRYVGRLHATRIYANGMCLEEYIEQLVK